MVSAIVNPPPPLSETSAGKGADVSVVALEQSIRGQGRVFIKTKDFSTTIAAGARSGLTNITGLQYNKLNILGVAVVSEANTNWRIKFYSRLSIYNNLLFIICKWRNDSMSLFINGVDVSQALTTALTSNTTLTRSHRTILCDSSGGTFTVTLPAAANSKYQIYEIKKTDTSGVAVLIDANASETIDGDLTKSLNLQNESITIQSNGTNWYII